MFIFPQKEFILHILNAFKIKNETLAQFHLFTTIVYRCHLIPTGKGAYITYIYKKVYALCLCIESNTQILYLDTVRYRDFTVVYKMYTSGEVIARILR